MTTNPTDRRRLNLRPGLIASAAALLIAAGSSLWGWREIPAGARLPMHWNAAGEVDRYGSRTEALITMPLVMAGLCVMFAVLPRILPRRNQMARSARAYNACWIGVLVLLTGVHVVSIVNATGGRVPMPQVVFAGVGILLVLVGNYVPKTRGNWAVGVRTPWTLESERSWELTNRLAGRLLAVVGLIVLAVAFVLPAPAVVVVLLAGAVGACVWPIAYSWWIWRSDPHTADAEADER